MDTMQNNVLVSMTSSFLLGIIVGFGGYWLLFDKGPFEVAAPDGGAELAQTAASATGDKSDGRNGTLPEDADKSGAPSASALDIVAEGENTLVVANQPAGDEMVVSMIATDVNGWIAIHETAADGGPGSILGARRFDAGRYFAEGIELLRATEEGMSYFAVLHADNGDSEFDYEVEVPLKDAQGSIISEEFIATANAN